MNSPKRLYRTYNLSGKALFEKKCEIRLNVAQMYLLNPDARMMDIWSEPPPERYDKDHLPDGVIRVDY